MSRLNFLLVATVLVAISNVRADDLDIFAWESKEAVVLESTDLPNPEFNGIEERLVNGQLANAGDLPWYALLFSRRPDNSWIFCGGTLISRNVVLSEGNCLAFSQELRVFFGSNTFGLGHRIDGRRYINHPNHRGGNNEFNFGLLQLSERINITNRIRPIGLPPNELEYFAFENLIVRFAGFGSAVRNQPNRELRWATYRVLPIDICAGKFPSSARHMMLCTANTPNSIAHPGYGDQGSALLWRSNQGIMVIGVFTRVLNPNNLSEGPAGFVNVAPHVRWISRLVAVA